MKTPEQIAKETLTRSTRNPMDILGHIVHAIEADRAQRRPLLDDAIARVTTNVPLGGADRLMVRDILVKLKGDA